MLSLARPQSSDLVELQLNSVFFRLPFFGATLADRCVVLFFAFSGAGPGVFPVGTALPFRFLPAFPPFICAPSLKDEWNQPLGSGSVVSVTREGLSQQLLFRVHAHTGRESCSSGEENRDQRRWRSLSENAGPH